MKKGMFFTIDSILAAGVIFIVVLYTSSLYIEDQPSFYMNYLSQDLMRVLSTLNVKEAGNEYINILINDGTITDLSNTVLEQILEFWADDQLAFASKASSNVTDPFLSGIIGFGIWIDDELIYSRDIPIRKSLVSSKKIISGFEKGKTSGATRNNPPALLGPALVEVRVWN